MKYAINGLNDDERGVRFVYGPGGKPEVTIINDYILHNPSKLITF